MIETAKQISTPTVRKVTVKPTKTSQSSLKKKLNFLVAHRNSHIHEEYSEYAIYIKDFTKKFKKFVAVDNATIKVTKGTIHGFIGPNGSGKTTTIKCLISAMVPSKGQLMIYGRDSWTVAAKKQIGYIPESARFPRRITTYDYLVSMGQVSGLPLKQAKTKTEEILKDLKLWKFKKRNPNDYSSGMKKKVLLAQSLLNNPDILILDEPAANLDPTARTELFNDLKKLRDQGKSIFISSHILSELQALADEVTILNYSKVVFHGPVKSEADNQYEIETSDNAEFATILKEKRFKVAKEGKNLILKIGSDEELNEVVALALKTKITIRMMKPYVVDLQTMYEKIVMSNTPESHKKKGKK